LLSLDTVDGSRQGHSQRAPGPLSGLVAAAADIAIRMKAEIVDVAQRPLAHFAVELDAGRRQSHELVA
jgi:hypothetical protein